MRKSALKDDVVFVPVDSGTIEMSSTGDMAAAAKLYSHGQDLAMFTADVIWDGEKGGVKTPQGDGEHAVRLRIFKNEKEASKAFRKASEVGGDSPLMSTL